MADLDPDHVVLKDVIYTYASDSTMIIVVDTATRDKYFLTLRSNEFIGSIKDTKIPEQEIRQLQACAQQQILHVAPKSLFDEALKREPSIKRADFTPILEDECSDSWMLHGYNTIMTADLEHGKIVRVVDLEEYRK